MAVRKMTPEGISPYPLDVEALEKGDYISPDWLIENGFKCKDLKLAAWGLELLNYGGLIQKSLHRLGRRWTVRQEKQGLRICEDEAALVVTGNRFDHHVKGMRNAHADTMGIDPSCLTQESRTILERRVVNQARVIQAVSKARRVPALQAFKRTTPGLPTATKENTNAQK